MDVRRTPAGCAPGMVHIKINDIQSFILEAIQELHFCVAYSDKSWMDLFRESLNQTPMFHVEHPFGYLLLGWELSCCRDKYLYTLSRQNLNDPALTCHIQFRL